MGGEREYVHDGLIFRTAPFFCGQGWPKGYKYEIPREMPGLEIPVDLQPNDVEWLQDMIVSHNAERKVYELEIRRDLRQCGTFLGEDFSISDLGKEFEQYPGYERTWLAANVICARLYEQWAIWMLYILCEDILQNETGEKRGLLELLEGADRCTAAIEKSVEYQAEILKLPDELKAVYKHYLLVGVLPGEKRETSIGSYPIACIGRPRFPLVGIYREFVNAHADELKRYELQYSPRDSAKKKGKKKEKSSVRVPYWMSTAGIRYAETWLVDTLGRNPGHECEKCIRRWDSKALAKNYMAVIDDYVNIRIKESYPVIDSQSRTAGWTTDRIDTAAYLSMYTDICAGTKRRICPLCGKIFLCQSNHPNETYCKNHSKSQKALFKRKVEAAEKLGETECLEGEV